MPSLPENWFREGPRSNRSGCITLKGRHLTTTSGALSATTDSPGYTLTKVGGQAGRYTVQFVNAKNEAVTFLKLVSFHWWVETTGAMTATRGGAGTCHIRGGSATVATNGTLIIQLTQVSGADAEVDDGATIGLEFEVKKSSAVP